MASYLCDTNLLVRLVDAPAPQHPIAAGALARLFRERHDIFITAQNLIEFWAVATRPVGANGLGWSTEATIHEMAALQERSPLVADSRLFFGSGWFWFSGIPSPASECMTPDSWRC